VPAFTDLPRGMLFWAQLATNAATNSTTAMRGKHRDVRRRCSIDAL